MSELLFGCARHSAMATNIAPEASPLKTCGRCLQELPQSAFLPKQWTNSSWKGTARRCNDCIGNGYRATHDGYCATKAGISREPAEVTATVAAAAGRVGGAVGAAFPEAWAAACTEVQASDLGRLSAVLIRNLSAAGASKAEKIAHRALAEECWLALGGRPPRAPPTSKVRAQQANGAGGSAGEWTGGAGLLATTEAARGRKALAAAELAAAVAEHYPSLRLGPDVASMPALVFLPCATASYGAASCAAPCAAPGLAPGVTAGASIHGGPGATPGADGADVEAALAAVHAAAVSFSSAHRVWAVHQTAATVDETARLGARLLSTALAVHPKREGATFAIRCECYPPRAAALSRSALIDSIGAQLDTYLGASQVGGMVATVDLLAPDVELMLRGFDVGGTRLCGLAISAGQTLSAALSGRAVCFDDGDDRASEGRPYFVRGANGGGAGATVAAAGDEAAAGGEAPREASSGEAAPDEVALPQLLASLEAALAAASVVGVGGEVDVGEGVVGAPASAEVVVKASHPDAPEISPEMSPVAVSEPPSQLGLESRNARRRRRRERSGQTESLCQALSAGGVLGTSKRIDAAARTPLPMWTVEFGAGTGSLSKRLAADTRELASPLVGQVLIDRSCGRGGRKSHTSTAAGEDRYATCCSMHTPRRCRSPHAGSPSRLLSPHLLCASPCSTQLARALNR